MHSPTLSTRAQKLSASCRVCRESMRYQEYVLSGLQHRPTSPHKMRTVLTTPAGGKHMWPCMAFCCCGLLWLFLKHREPGNPEAATAAYIQMRNGKVCPHKGTCAFHDYCTTPTPRTSLCTNTGNKNVLTHYADHGRRVTGKHLKYPQDMQTA